MVCRLYFHLSSDLLSVDGLVHDAEEPCDLILAGGSGSEAQLVWRDKSRVVVVQLLLDPVQYDALDELCRWRYDADGPYLI
jgi:hypothetical protein